MSTDNLEDAVGLMANMAERYFHAQVSVICEHSGDINASVRRLHAELTDELAPWGMTPPPLPDWIDPEEPEPVIMNARVFPYRDDAGRSSWCARCDVDGFPRSEHGATPARAMNALEAIVGRIQWIAKPDPDAQCGEMIQAPDERTS